MTQKDVRKRVRSAKPYIEVKEKIRKRGSVRVIDGEAYRGHSLSPQKLKSLLSLWRRTGRFPSPYSKGIRSDHLLALVELGVNKAWELGSEIKPVLKLIMFETADRKYKNRWDRFVLNVRGRNPGDVTERMYGNYLSFRRLCLDEEGRVGGGGKSPYGMRLWQMNCCVDIFTMPVTRRVGGREVVKTIRRFVRLNTFSGVPLTMTVTRRSMIPPVSRERGRTLGPYTARGKKKK